MTIKSIRTGWTGISLRAGYVEIPGDFESIATVAVGSGGAASISFTSIPSSFQHLQIRGILSDSRSGVSYSQFYLTFNSDTGSNYSRHYIYGDPRPYVEAGATVSTTSIAFNGITGNAVPTTDNKFGVTVIDVLDYKDTNKYKTVKGLTGQHVNTGGNSGVNGIVTFTSGNWRNTAAITSIQITPLTANFKQYSHLALYGIRG